MSSTSRTTTAVGEAIVKRARELAVKDGTTLSEAQEAHLQVAVHGGVSTCRFADRMVVHHLVDRARRSLGY